jgi:hypothetical protein
MYSTIRFGTASKATPQGRRLYRMGVEFELAIKRSPALRLDHLATTSLYIDSTIVTFYHKPEQASVFKNFFLWQNADMGWAVTVIGRVSFEEFIVTESSRFIFQGRSTTLTSWTEGFTRNSLFVDYTGLPLGTSFIATSDTPDDFSETKGIQEGVMLLPWNEVAGGGLLITNCTFVNFKNGCIRYVVVCIYHASLNQCAPP